MALKHVGFILLALVVLVFCGCSGKTEEDLIRETIARLGDYAEDRDVDGMLTLISSSYSDDKERAYEDIEDLLAEYLERYRGIAVNVLGTKIIEISPLAAAVETDTGFSSGAARIFRKAAGYSGYYFRFNVEFVKENEKWKVKSASWKNIEENELLPESAEKVKEL
ncbi:MAG: hypothetical protein GY950_15760 [bacterium]|nr:hypothetical protein [bacterium]